MGGEALLNYLIPILDQMNITSIIHGGAKGIDSLAGTYAQLRNLPETIIRPNYEKFGKAAPMIRNGDLVQQAEAVLCVYSQDAIRKGGTGDTYRKSVKAGKLIAEIIPEQNKVIRYPLAPTLF